MSRLRGRRLLPIALATVVLALFLGLSAGARYLFDQTEDRLLQERTAEAGSALQISVNQIRAPLEAAARLAEATDGDQTAFAHIVEPYVGTNKSYNAVALYKIGENTPMTVVGGPIALPAGGTEGVPSVLAKASTEPFVLVDLLGGDKRRLGYAVSDGKKPPTYVAYGERTLSTDPNVRRRTDEPFAQLDYAMYLGTAPSSPHLLTASVRNLPLDGRRAQQIVPFGDQQLLLQMTPIGHLSGDLFANLWWIVAAGGVFLAAAFGVLTYRLLERRDTAVTLAQENEQLYDEQRHIAETLQLSLLPQHLVAPPGLSIAARYWPAGAANLIGGDFYDAFRVDDHRWAIAIGDVCGKGIEAAALTGLARHTLRAAARRSTNPADVLRAVHQALLDHQPPTFCTACFAFVTQLHDGTDRIELALGGHPQPLLRLADGRVERIGEPGTLLGMIEPSLTSTVVDLHAGDLVVFYTDGLTDAPADQAVSVEELSSVLEVGGDQPIEQLADSIRVLKRRRRPLGSGDDTALLIVRLGEPSARAPEASTPSEHAFD